MIELIIDYCLLIIVLRLVRAGEAAKILWGGIRLRQKFGRDKRGLQGFAREHLRHKQPGNFNREHYR